MQQITLNNWLAAQEHDFGLDAALSRLIAGVAAVSRDISRRVEMGALGGVLGLHGTQNVQGEDQKELDGKGHVRHGLDRGSR